MNVKVRIVGLCILVLLAGTVQARQDTCGLFTVNSPDIEVIKPNIHDAATIGYFTREIENGGGITRFLWGPDDWEADAQKLAAENQKETDPAKRYNTTDQISRDYYFAIKKLCEDNGDGSNNVRISHDAVQFIKGGGFISINPNVQLDLLTDAISKDPYNFEAYREKIILLKGMGEWDEADAVEKQLSAAQARQLEHEAGEFLPVSPVVALLSIVIAVIGIGIKRRRNFR